MLPHNHGAVRRCAHLPWIRQGISGHKRGMFTACALALFAQPALATTVRTVRAGNAGVTLDFDGMPGEAHIFALDNPPRIALDIDNVRPGHERDAAGPVAQVREAVRNGAGVRVVLDLSGYSRLTDAHFTPDGRHLELGLDRATAGEFATLVGADPVNLAPSAAMARRPSTAYVVSMPLGRPRTATGDVAIAGPNDPALPLVVIDPGHGGHDPGALNPETGAREKDVTLAIARRLRDALVATGRVRVAMTRSDDRFVVLRDRFALARRLDASLFISIHADAAANSDASGATVYTLSEVASDREAQRLAARENKADIINGVDLGSTGSDVSSILIDLTQRETMNMSSDFAHTLVRTAGPTLDMKSEPHRFASLVVLKAPDIPSVLIETGYITNPHDEARLTSRAGQTRIADAIADAVRLHFARRIASR